MKQIRALIFIIAILSQNYIYVYCASTNQQGEDENMKIIKQIMDKIFQMKKTLNNSTQQKQSSPNQIIKLNILNIENNLNSVYLGPRLQEIFLALHTILSEDTISYDSFKSWTYEYGINLVGMTGGALLALQLCEILSITNPHLKVISMISMAYVGDKTVDLLKRYDPNYVLKKEDILNIIEMDSAHSQAIIKYIKEHYLEISLYYINQYK
ncbi:hypothetical protein TTHERM_01035640 (macronuclear) [Tetrahymena thermophila SB210]|uniref:Uncharacterized protein n=1 Tax=Tetrahymena thermophila (strain SB210) TaxID=312017 RepID=Q24I96_TETTS|nr:hypothetical protein TTHERM_01035640 [Tetrahymena thermophila SB210]EAS07501.1 hypothetical protein TTHERM_01035640 [Tetrahymena thermophila SB210]|eukprot:XP_001027743.1 hypothetical protein TTHERM_01035640 [Tetrahymena thermophila SB210]